MFNRFTCNIAAALLLTSAVHASSFSSRIEDDVDVFLSFRSIADFENQWAGHPFERVFEDPDLQSFFAPLVDLDIDAGDEAFVTVLEEEFGLSVDDFFELCPGEFALSFFNLPAVLLEDEVAPELVLMVEFTGDAETLDELMQIQFDRNAAEHQEWSPDSEHTLIEESFMGETLFFDEVLDGEETYIEDGYAFVDGIFILATTQERLRMAVEAIKDGPDSPLAENASFVRSREMGGRGDVLFYGNFEEILPPFNDALIAWSMDSGAAMFGLSAPSLDAALSLESLLGFHLDLDVVDDGLLFTSGIVYQEKSGLVSLITYGDGPLPAARYVPNGVFSSSLTTFDLGAFSEQLEQIVSGASPTLLPLIDMQMRNVQTNTGVDLRASILRNFGSEIVSLSMLPEESLSSSGVPEPEQVVLVELRDADAFSGALEALKDLVPGAREMIQRREFGEYAIFTIEGVADPAMPDQTAADVSYVVTRSHFILSIGRVGLLQEVLTRMDGDGDGFWNSASTEALFERVEKPSPISRSYVDVEQMVRPIFESIVQTSQLGGLGLGFKMEDIPEDLNIPFVVITEMNEAEDGLFSRSLILEKEAAE